MEDYILDEMTKYNADGVDFVPIFFRGEDLPKIICSYTREQILKGVFGYPKTNRLYWNIVDGKKVYVDGQM